jgi:hypothetical protein
MVVLYLKKMELRTVSPSPGTHPVTCGSRAKPRPAVRPNLPSEPTSGSTHQQDNENNDPDCPKYCATDMGVDLLQIIPWDDWIMATAVPSVRNRTQTRCHGPIHLAPALECVAPPRHEIRTRWRNMHGKLLVAFAKHQIPAVLLSFACLSSLRAAETASAAAVDIAVAIAKSNDN